MTSHAINQAMKESIRRKIKDDLLCVLSPFGLLDVEIKFDPSNIREITVKIPFSKRNPSDSYKVQGLDQLEYMKSKGYKCNLIWSNKDTGIVMTLLKENQV